MLNLIYNRFTATILSHRFLAYTSFSVACVSVVVANALRAYSNFYSVAVSLSKSSRSVLVLANFAFLIALVCGRLIQNVFFGTLRANEIERLYDRLWFFVTESLLAFTIFRDEFDVPFALMFGFLLFVKSFHWLAGDRIEWMDQRPYPGPPLSFHIRMISLFAMLWCIDLLMFLFSVENTLAQGVGGMVLFASEYGILMASILNTISKYLLSAYELRRAGRRGGENAPPWENKSMWTFYIELVTDFFKLTTYLAFFAIIITFYGVPLNIIRDVYITARSFISRLRALHRYQTATRNMDQRYPNATPEELAATSDRTCIICREEMALLATEAQGQDQPNGNLDGPNTTPKKLPCGHIFHFHCLRSWLERQQSCPTCRRTVLDGPVPQGTHAVPAPDANAQVPAGARDGVNQNQPPNNPLGNPLGLVGRLLGAPGQQNQAINRAANPPNNGNDRTIVPARNANGDQPFHEVVIRYHIPAGQPTQPLVRPLEQVPTYQGFVGPNGIWQPWRPARDQSGNNESTVTDANGHQDRPDSDSPTNATPREAAALAALRRYSAGGRIPSIGNGRASEAHGQSDQDNGHASLSSASPAPKVPNLIPLSNLTPKLGGNLSRNVGASGHTLPSSAQADYSSPSRSEIQNTQTHSSGSSISRDELSSLDQLTREVIDERLRVLESVSNTLYRCIDELMQMRSTLPTSHQPSTSENGSLSGSSKRSGGGEPLAGPSQTQDKGKAPEGTTTSAVE